MAAVSCLGVLSAAAMVAPTVASGRVIEQVPSVTEVDGFRGRLVWSHQRPGSKRYVLMTRYRGRTSQVRIPGRSAPFDVDLGPDATGRTAAVYSRCERPASLRGCDLFLYDFARGRERRLRGVGTRASSEFEPSLWRGRVAFGTRPDRSRGPDVPGEIRVERLDGRGDAERYSGSLAPLDTESASTAVASIDLRGRQLVYVWRVHPERCRAGDEVFQDPTGGSGVPHAELWLGHDDGTQTLLEKGCGRDPATGGFDRPAFLHPTLTGSEVTYLAITSGVRWWIRSYRRSTGAYKERRTVPSASSYIDFGDAVVRARVKRVGRVTGTRIEQLAAPRLAPAQDYPSSSELGPPVGTRGRPPGS